jgi:DUF971 family protein
MLENNLRQRQSTQEGIVVSDPEGVVIAWRDGIARRFSWDQLRELSMSKEMGGQSAKQESALVQQAA